MSAGPEAKVLAKIMRWLKTSASSGWWVKIHGGPYQRSGIPDIIGCYCGRLVGIETKSPAAYRKPGHDLSALQKATLEDIKHSGGATLVTYDVEEVKAFIQKVRDGKL